MTYIDGVIASVPTANKAAYLEHARIAAGVFRDHGALRVVDAWGDDVPEGKVTDYYRATQAKPGETVIFSWIEWPDRAARDAGMAKAFEDERLTSIDMPFDGQRMVIGSFDVISDR